MGSDPRLAPGGLAGLDVVVESTAPEATPFAEFLGSEDARARLVTPAKLDRDPHADVAFLDAWTPEVATRVAGLRQGGALVTCFADLLLARAGSRAVAVTGSAGKTTTTSLIVHLLRGVGIEAAAPAPGISGNLWPDASLLSALEETLPIAFELTSSHLAYCGGSPHVAVVTSFWADHLELHGSLGAYAHAKEAIVRQQPPESWLVVPDDGTCERFVSATPARVARFSLANPVEQGAFVRGSRLVARWEGEEVEIADLASLPVQGRCVGNVLAACAAGLAVGATPASLAQALGGATVPAHRFVEVARIGGVPVYDDSMAGTPAKATAALELFRDDSIVLVVGGETHSAGGPVHATPDERNLLEVACTLARRKTRRTVVFGPAGSRLA